MRATRIVAAGERLFSFLLSCSPLLCPALPCSTLQCGAFYDPFFILSHPTPTHRGRVSSRSSKIANPHADELERKAMEEEDVGAEVGEEGDAEDTSASGTGKENKAGRNKKKKKQSRKKKKEKEKEKEREKTPRVQEVSGEEEDDVGFFNL